MSNRIMTNEDIDYKMPSIEEVIYIFEFEIYNASEIYFKLHPHFTKFCSTLCTDYFCKVALLLANDFT